MKKIIVIFALMLIIVSARTIFAQNIPVAQMKQQGIEFLKKVNELKAALGQDDETLNSKEIKAAEKAAEQLVNAKSEEIVRKFELFEKAERIFVQKLIDEKSKNEYSLDSLKKEDQENEKKRKKAEEELNFLKAKASENERMQKRIDEIVGNTVYPEKAKVEKPVKKAATKKSIPKKIQQKDIEILKLFYNTFKEISIKKDPSTLLPGFKEAYSIAAKYSIPTNVKHAKVETFYKDFLRFEEKSNAWVDNAKKATEQKLKKATEQKSKVDTSLNDIKKLQEQLSSDPLNIKSETITLDKNGNVIERKVIRKGSVKKDK